ncbi:MAG TPA: hypothetical protein VJN70_17510 [Gemmatimonadaceae bacterium]|nr:hypothetical protein [Gemmatimonadaceae bacterium]
MRDERRDVAREVAERLRARGIHLTSHETDGELVRLLEAVERFEAIVEDRGGDLMVDEPVGDRPPREPDDQRFVIPVRHSNESVDTFLTRIVLATERAAE